MLSTVQQQVGMLDEQGREDACVTCNLGSGEADHAEELAAAQRTLFALFNKGSAAPAAGPLHLGL